MSSVTLCIRAYLCLLLAGITAIAVVVLMAAQDSITTSEVSQKGLSVQLAASNFLSTQFLLLQASIVKTLKIGTVDATVVARLRYAAPIFLISSLISLSIMLPVGPNQMGSWHWFSRSCF